MSLTTATITQARIVLTIMQYMQYLLWKSINNNYRHIIYLFSLSTIFLCIETAMKSGLFRFSNTINQGQLHGN